DLSSPTFENLLDLAVFRVLDAAICLSTRPPRLFPTTETVFGRYFTSEDWHKYGDMETEMGRMNYMLSNLPERGIPAICLPTIDTVLSSSCVLASWKRVLRRLESCVSEEFSWVIRQMQNQKSVSSYSSKSDFISVPMDYRINPRSQHAKQLWNRSLLEISVQISQGRFEHAKSFLQIFAFLKDPLGGLESAFDKAVLFFVYMVASLAKTPLHPARYRSAIVQAAQEALFLSTPLLQDINHVHFTGHQQLPYVYVALDQLPRSEFSIPGHVVHIIEEMLTTAEYSALHTCAIAPISVSSYPGLPLGKGKHTTVIIDGNHRATATMVLRLIAKHPGILEMKDPDDVLSAFCADHKLGLKWKIDLADVLMALRNSPCSTLIQTKMHLVRDFRGVDTIPALVVREDNFFTACQQRPPLDDRPRLLLPFHQALFNDEKLGFAFPQAGQVHGRAVGFKPMPL
ncbi:hypothetical protein P170DRAFT_341584, partial [Aspergillus steynii IBT 23096]